MNPEEPNETRFDIAAGASSKVRMYPLGICNESPCCLRFDIGGHPGIWPIGFAALQPLGTKRGLWPGRPTGRVSRYTKDQTGSACCSICLKHEEKRHPVFLNTRYVRLAYDMALTVARLLFIMNSPFDRVPEGVRTVQIAWHGVAWRGPTVRRSSHQCSTSV